MSGSSQDKTQLAKLVAQLAVVHGKVTLSSGIEADYYVDLRRATLHHEAAVLVGKVMLDLFAEAGLKPDAVGGLTMGADPVASAMLHQASARGLQLDAFVVRKEAKKHGMARQVEGPDIHGRKVVILEDTSTTGGSPLAAAKAAEDAGAEVLAVATVVDRDTGARAAIESAGYAYYSALSLSDLGL
jgi:orotate phosphoribosyltransferase